MYTCVTLLPRYYKRDDIVWSPGASAQQILECRETVYALISNMRVVFLSRRKADSGEREDRFNFRPKIERYTFRFIPPFARTARKAIAGFYRHHADTISYVDRGIIFFIAGVK